MKNIFVFIVFISFFVNVFSQDTDYHWYENDGKLFYNRHLPAYMWISTSPTDNSQDILMTSQRTKAYTNPMYFDSDGYNTFQYANAVDTATMEKAYPPQHVVFKVYIDGYAPILQAYFLGTRRYYKNSSPVYALNLKVKLTAKDGMSGVEKIMFSLNGEDYQEYSEPIPFPKAGEFQLKYYALDNTGNKSKIKSYKFLVK